jgi:hypothetical protein
MNPSTLTIRSGLGALAFWNTKSTLRQRVQTAAEQAGIERFVPSQPSPSAVLREAMIETAKQLCGRVRRHPFMVRRLADSHSFEVRQVHPRKHENDYDFCFSATITNAWCMDVLRVGETMASADAVFHHLLSKVKERRDYLPAPMVSDVMVRALQSWSATRLKDDGGVWFVPSEHVNRYRAFAYAIAGDGDGPRFCVTPFEIGSDPDTVSHVLDSLRSEVTTGIQDIMDELLESQGSLQARSLRTRADRVNGYLDKVVQYEAITGHALSDLSAAIEQARQALALNRLLSVAV